MAKELGTKYLSWNLFPICFLSWAPPGTNEDAPGVPGGGCEVVAPCGSQRAIISVENWARHLRTAVHPVTSWSQRTAMVVSPVRHEQGVAPGGQEPILAELASTEVRRVL